MSDVAGTTSESRPLRHPARAPAVQPAFGMALRSAPRSVEIARRVTEAWVRHHFHPADERVDAAVLVMSELCTNVVRYGHHDSIDVRGWKAGPSLFWLEVHDRTPSAVPIPQHAGPEAESGRGLFLVNALVQELGGTWGFRQGGSCAWCRLPLLRERR